MALKKLGSKTTSKGSTKQKSQVEEDDEDEQETEQETDDDEEDEAPVVNKSKKSTSNKKAAKDEDDDDDSDPYANEAIKGNVAKSLAKGRAELPFTGDYTLKIEKFRVMKPDVEKQLPGFLGVTFEVVDGPEDEPEDGWPHIEYRFFVKFPKGMTLDKKQKQREEISEQESWRFATACLGEFDDSEEYTRLEVIKETVGCTVLVSNAASKDGQYKNLKNWRPAEE